MRAISIGECMVELSAAPDGRLARGFAGDAYNTAVYLKRSDPRLDVQFATVLGADPFSAQMREAWREEGIGGELAYTAPDRNLGLYLIETDPQGERSFHYWRGESAAKGWLRTLMAHGGADLLAGAGLVYLSGISLAILEPSDRAEALELMRALRGRVGLVAFDPNYRAALWASEGAAREVVNKAFGLADLVLPSQEDLERLYGVRTPDAQLDLLRELSASEVALTTGPGQCFVLSDGAAFEVEGPRASTVIDTSGAGDSFNGAYLASRLAGQGPRQAALAGLALAAEVVGSRGAIIATKPGPS